jgi:crotonobetainyl-CoA:carnitine CoA-transferase CaiB-like acyl-CoA transferase
MLPFDGCTTTLTAYKRHQRADSITGFYAAYGILGALHDRERIGKGLSVEVSMLEAMTHFNMDAFTHYYSANPMVSQSCVMKCRDGKWLALHMSSPAKFWHGLTTVIGTGITMRCLFRETTCRLCLSRSTKSRARCMSPWQIGMRKGRAVCWSG